MRFLHPGWLHLAWLALIPLALYLFRRRARRMAVSTLLFFRSLAREHQESAWLRRVKRWLSLLLTLAVILLGVLALARPVGGGAQGSPGSVVVVLDVSASMAARDASGATRLEAAIADITSRVRSLPESVVASLLVFDAKPAALLSRSRNRRELVRLLGDLKPQPVEGNVSAALKAAARIAALDQTSEIWHVSDTPPADADREAAQGITLRFTSVALRDPLNAGITGFQLRKAPLARDRLEGFVRVTASAANASACAASLEVRIGGRLAQLREIELKPGESSTMIVPVEGVRGQLAEIELKTPGDCLPHDDLVIARLPELKPLLVAWFAEEPDPFTSVAITSLVEAGKLDVMRGAPKDWPPKEKPGVYVFEHWLPPEWPQDRPAVVLSPRQSSGPVKAESLGDRGVPADNVRAVAAEHPVLYRVSASRLSITQTTRIAPGVSLQPLWLAGQEPVLAAGEVQGQRVVVTAFSPSRSEQLALLPAFPLVLGNAIYWCAEGGDAAAESKPLRPGDWLQTGGPLRWHEWSGGDIRETADEVAGGGIELRRIGAWEDAEGRSGLTFLGSEIETNLPKLSDDNATSPNPPATAWSSTGGDWSKRLLWALLALLVAESFLFHRRAVY